MTRTIFAIAIALFTATTFFSPAAKACISCEYVPPVVNTPVYSHTPKYTRSKSHAVVKRRRAKKEIAKTPSVKTIERSETAAAKPVKKPDPVETASVDKDEPVMENSSITTAASDKAEVEMAPTGDSQASNAGTCKKFFASVGMTLTVPCQ